jgi:hypothetical protein
MKKILLIILPILLLTGCSGRRSQPPEISPVLSASYIDANQMMSFTFSEKTDSRTVEYSVNRVDHTAIFSCGYGSDAGTVNSTTWDDEKWDSFINDLSGCGVFEWHRMNREAGEQGDWSIVMTGDFGITTLSGSGSYPPKWEEFKEVLSDYFGETEERISPEVS